MKEIVINCFGDSVTEGMRMIGHHTAEYGKDTYPAQLYTMLKDSGYNAVVNNYGHGGERVAEAAVRSGAHACILCEDIVLPGTGESVSLGQKEEEGGKVLNTKIKILCGETPSDDRCVYFTQMSHDTNPVMINGIQVHMSVLNDCENVIALANPDRVDVLLPKDSVLFTADNRNADVNIFYAGINDNKNLSLKEYIELMKSCIAANGGKGIILGSTRSIWNNWSGLEGSDEEKYVTYKRECYKALGVHFIDMYGEFAKRGLDMALANGELKGKTEDELNAMREKLSKHIIPAEFTYDEKTENDVHLSRVGYSVVAGLVFERMKQLSYID